MPFHCEICGKDPIDGHTTYRINPKGEAAVCRCFEHLPEGFEIDPVVLELTSIIESDGKPQH